MAELIQTLVFEARLSPETLVSSFTPADHPVPYSTDAVAGRRYYLIGGVQPYAESDPQPDTAGVVIPDADGPELNDMLTNDDSEPIVSFGAGFRDMFVQSVEAFECGGRSRIALTVYLDQGSSVNGAIKARQLRIRAFEEMRLFYKQDDAAGHHRAMRPFLAVDQDAIAPDDRDSLSNEANSYLSVLAGAGVPVQLLGVNTPPSGGQTLSLAKIVPHKVQGRSWIVVVAANGLSDANQENEPLP